MTDAPFPPSQPVGLTSTINSYLYFQYTDDPSCQQLVDAYNALTQAYVTWFATIGLPIYTQLTGNLLDWVAAGVYGIWRPVLTSGVANVIGPYNTMAWNSLALNEREALTTSIFLPVTDDIFKRIITWNFYKADGFQYSTSWLKRRVHRWMNGPNGVAPAVQDRTDDVSVKYTNRTITVYLDNTQLAQLLQVSATDGVINLPVQYAYVFQLQQSLGDVGGFVTLLTDTSPPYPTSTSGLPTGGIWNSSGSLKIAGTTTPNPTAAPVFFAFITAAQLKTLGGANLPHAAGAPGQLWNNAGSVAVS